MLGGLICGLIVGIAIGLLFAAVILRSACHLVGVKVPEMMQAIGINIVAGLACLLPNYGAKLGAEYALANYQLDLMTVTIGLMVVNLLSNMLIAALVYASMLDTSFGKGIIIYWVQVAIIVLIAGVVLAVIFLLDGGVEMPKIFNRN